MRTSKSNRRKPARRLPRLPRLPSIRPRLDPRLVRVPVVAALGLAFAAALAGALDQPVRRLVVEGELERVTAMQVEAAIADELGAGLFALDLDALKARIETIDWVGEASVARSWPDGLHVSVSEHRAAARWGETALLNVHGERFTDDSPYPYPELPRLDGPPGGERQAAAYYLAVRGRLIEAGHELETLKLDARGALFLELAGGQELRFGRDDVEARIERFFGIVLPAIGGDFGRVRHVDLRYTNGFAVAWQEEPPRDREVLSMEPASRG